MQRVSQISAQRRTELPCESDTTQTNAKLVHDHKTDIANVGKAFTMLPHLVASVRGGVTERDGLEDVPSKFPPTQRAIRQTMLACIRNNSGRKCRWCYRCDYAWVWNNLARCRCLEKDERCTVHGVTVGQQICCMYRGAMRIIGRSSYDHSADAFKDRTCSAADGRCDHRMVLDTRWWRDNHTCE